MATIPSQFALGQFDLMEHIGKQVEVERAIYAGYEANKAVMGKINSWMADQLECYTEYFEAEGVSFIDMMSECHLNRGSLYWEGSIDLENSD